MHHPMENIHGFHHDFTNPCSPTISAKVNSLQSDGCNQYYFGELGLGNFK
jgi:hypothetical protein